MTRLSPFDMAVGLLVALIWGMGFVFAKAAINQVPPIFLMAMRFSIAALVLVWFARVPRGQIVRIFWISMISAALQYSLTFTGVKGLDASVATLIVQLEVPFLVILGALFLQEKPGIRKWIGIMLAFVGVGLIAGEPRVGTAWISVLLVIGGAATWAIGQAMIRTLRDIDGLTATAWVAVFAAPQLFVMSFVFESGQIEALMLADWVVWAAITYLGLVMTALGYGLWYSLVRKYPISLVAPFLLMLPVFTVIGSVAFLSEQLTPHILIGGLIVISGVAFVIVEKQPVVAGATE